MSIHGTTDRLAIRTILYYLCNVRIILDCHMNTHMRVMVLIFKYLNGTKDEHILILANRICRKDIFLLRDDLVSIGNADKLHHLPMQKWQII